MEAAIRPWRTATFVASAIALAELAALVVAVLLLVGGPLARGIRRDAAAKAAAARVSARVAAPVRKLHLVPDPAVARLSRAHTRVLVLNGNGRAGAAGQQAITLQTLGYAVAATANAKRTGGASIVMYRPGYRPEAIRLARDAGIKLVGPLDGLRAADLRGSQLAVIVGS